MHRPPTPHFFPPPPPGFPFSNRLSYPIPSHCSLLLRAHLSVAIPISFPFPALFLTPLISRQPRAPPLATPLLQTEPTEAFLVRGLVTTTHFAQLSTPAAASVRAEGLLSGCRPIHFSGTGIIAPCLAPHLPAPRLRCDKISIHHQHSQHQRETSWAVPSLVSTAPTALSFALQATNFLFVLHRLLGSDHHHHTFVH